MDVVLFYKSYLGIMDARPKIAFILDKMTSNSPVSLNNVRLSCLSSIQMATNTLTMINA